MPLLGPIGGGLAGAAVGGLAGAAVVAVAGGAAAAASSEARTISLFDTALKPFLLLFWGEKAMQFLEEFEVFDVIRELEDDDENINPAAADAMLQVAMVSLSLSNRVYLKARDNAQGNRMRSFS